MSLSRLRIENFAIIEALEIDFRPGLTILTGETGAGKSIIIDALNLALGEKANPNLIRAGAEVALVQCDFSLENIAPAVNEILERRGIPSQGKQLSLRRELALTGRSRAWVNDTTCPLSTLKEIGNLLVDLHGQHDHQSLLNEETHINFLDAYGDYGNLIQKVAQAFSQVGLLQEKRDLLRQKLNILREKRELWTFQLQEIQKVAPKPDEYEDLLAEKTILENAEKIHNLVTSITDELFEKEDSLYQKVLSVNKSIASLSRYAPNFNEDLNKLSEHQYYYQELAKQLARFGSEVQFNPLRLEAVNQRLYALQQLLKKYGPTLDEVLKMQATLIENLNQDDDLQLQIAQVERQLAESIQSYLLLAQQLSEQRHAQARLYEQELEKVLSRLGIRGATFRVKIERVPDPQGWAVIDGVAYRAESSGLDRVTFEISTNPGEPLRPLSQIVSGGEVSRIMLAIKSILAGRDQIPVLIFDEIDSGISGQIARIVGEELRELAKVHQIICITHLPQIAGLAQDHLSVTKVSSDGRSRTELKRLNSEERVTAIAQLIGGKTITEAAKRQARELIE